MKNKILIALCFFTLHGFSQTVLGVDTLLKSGPVNKRINLVIVSEGYTAAQMPQFITDATTAYNHLLNTEPYNFYKGYFNVFAIKCVSPQSGVSHPGTASDVAEPLIPVTSVTNNFNTSFDSFGIHRLLCSNNTTAVFSMLAAHFPDFNQVLILGNSAEYGGSGGVCAVSSTHPLSADIVVHELGHSFAGLADEYWAGTMYAQEKPNMTVNSNTLTNKWAPWLGIDGIGIYPYGTSAPESSWFRPHQNCRMQNLTAPFCAVCRQTIIERIHELTNPIDGYRPSNANPFAYMSSQWFSTKLLKPNPNTLHTSWEANGTEFAHNKDSVQLSGSLFSNGSNSVVFTAIDTTLLSKDVNHPTLHSYSVVWEVNYTVTGIREIKQQAEFSVFPNPASDLVNLDYTLSESANVSVSVSDPGGKTVLSGKNRSASPGSYSTKIDVAALAPGAYILSLRINDQTINTKIIIVK